VLEHGIAMVAMLTERDPFLRGGSTQGDSDELESTQSTQGESGASHTKEQQQDTTALQDYERKEQHGTQLCTCIQYVSSTESSCLCGFAHYLVLRCLSFHQ
jgi:hypothetical protein